MMKWLGLDGEGIGRHPHRYVMLCWAGDDCSDYIEDVNGLRTEEILTWLLTSPATSGRGRPTHRLAGYYLTYDWTMILRDLPNKAIYRLLRPELRQRDREEGGGFVPVRWRGFKLHYLSGMMRIERGGRKLTIWDVGRYYQSSFVIALERAGIAAPDLIQRMKLERGTWEDTDLDRMREYCLEECRLLSQLTALLERQHAAIGLEPAAWHGPGSTAGALMKQHRIDSYLASPPPEVEYAARCAYFGGRFEHSIIGERNDVVAYDIRSAYPWAAHTLPCLAHAVWERRTKLPQEGELAVIRYRVRDVGNRVWGPLPCRLDDGSIVWSRGDHSGWAWSVEYWAAMRGWQGVEFGGECWVLNRKCEHQPFDFVPKLYQWRVSQPENKQVVKLALNSLYGKLAQVVAGKYSSRVYAGIITASCRARMLDFISLHRDESNLLAIATDGAYSTERHDIGGPGLGDWEVEEEGAMSFLRPGIYWSDAKVRARGIGRKKMQAQIAEARRAIAQEVPRVALGTTVQFGSLRECVYRTPRGDTRRSLAYGEWVNMPVSLSLRPEPKRAADWRPPKLPSLESRPYEKQLTSADAKALQLVGSLLEGRIR